MSETATPAVSKPKRRGTKSNDAASAAPGNVTNIAAIQPGNNTPPTPEQLAALYAAIPADQRDKLIAGYSQRGNFKNAYTTVITALATMGITFGEKKPLMMLAFEDEDDDTAIYITADGEVRTNDNLDDGEDGEEEDEEEDEDDAEKPRRARGPGRPKGSTNKPVPAGTVLVKALREYMSEKGKTQMEMAERLGVSQGTISHWFNSGGEPRNGTAKKLAKIVAHYLP